jgi:hypothetical protein
MRRQRQLIAHHQPDMRNIRKPIPSLNDPQQTACRHHRVPVGNLLQLAIPNPLQEIVGTSLCFEDIHVNVGKVAGNRQYIQVHGWSTDARLMLPHSNWEMSIELSHFACFTQARQPCHPSQYQPCALRPTAN